MNESQAALTTGVLENNLQRDCSLCGAAVAPMWIARKRPGADVCPGFDGKLLCETASICPTHLPAEFATLPARVKQIAIGVVWAAIDEGRGRLPVSVRLPPVRRIVDRGGLLAEHDQHPTINRLRCVVAYFRSLIRGRTAKRALAPAAPRGREEGPPML